MKAVIWDMDGVLIDSEPFYADTIRAMYTSRGVVLSRDTERSMVGSSAFVNSRRVKELYPDIPDTAEELFLAHEQALLDGLARVEHLIGGVEEWLVRLRGHGVKLAVASSSTAPMLALAERNLRLGELFDTIVSANDVAASKPAPDIFLEAARRLGAQPSECLVIEDSQNGVRAARAAGMPVAVFTGAPGMGAQPSDGDWTFSKYDDAAFEMLFGRLDI